MNSLCRMYLAASFVCDFLVFGGLLLTTSGEVVPSLSTVKGRS